MHIDMPLCGTVGSPPSITKLSPPRRRPPQPCSNLMLWVFVARYMLYFTSYGPLDTHTYIHSTSVVRPCLNPDNQHFRPFGLRLLLCMDICTRSWVFLTEPNNLLILFFVFGLLSFACHFHERKGKQASFFALQVAPSKFAGKTKYSSLPFPFQVAVLRTLRLA